MMKKKNGSFPPIGACSLLVIFAVLCLALFASLSLSSAKSGERLSIRSAESVLARYDAEYSANRILSKLRQGNPPPEVTLEDGIYCYSVPLDQMNRLEVKVRIYSDGDYEILLWDTVSYEEWSPDDGLNVWQGD